MPATDEKPDRENGMDRFTWYRCVKWLAAAAMAHIAALPALAQKPPNILVMWGDDIGGFNSTIIMYSTDNGAETSWLGAFLGGTTRGAYQGLDSSAPSLITPPNFGSGGGNCAP